MSEQSLDPQRQEQARKYTRQMRRLLLLELALGAIFLLTVLLSGLSNGLRDLLEFPQSARVVLYFLILMISYVIISAPLSFYRSFALPIVTASHTKAGVHGWPMRQRRLF